MNLNELKEIVALGESETVEFKESVAHDRDIGKTCCAFANTSGGVILIGVRAEGTIVGVHDDIDVLQQRLSAANQSVSPAPLLSIDLVKDSGKLVVVMIIQRIADNAYCTYNGAIYVRVGSTNRRLDGRTHLEFLRNRHIISFDESRDTAITIDDLDETKIKGYLAFRNQDEYLRSHTIREFLLSNNLVQGGDSKKICNAAVLLFAKNPVQFIPQAEIKMVSFASDEPVDIVAHVLIQATVGEAVEQALSFLKKHLSRGIQLKLDDGRRTEVYEYPLGVLREALVNAVAHRDYFSNTAIQVSLFPNRAEITNPGSLPRGLSRELFGTISVPRNPITYRFLRDAKYVEGLGTGIPRMRNEMRKAGLGDPDFQISEAFFRVVFHGARRDKRPIRTASDLSSRQQNALKYLRRSKSIKAQTYAEINKVSQQTARNDLKELIDFGFVKKIGTFRGTYYVLTDRK